MLHEMWWNQYMKCKTLLFNDFESQLPVNMQRERIQKENARFTINNTTIKLFFLFKVVYIKQEFYHTF